MSTKASISVLLKDGSIESIYLHNDGYPDDAGLMLLNHYNSQELAEALVKLGDCSRLNKDLTSSVFYKRDRNEKNTETATYTSLKELEEYNRQQHNYYWDGKVWKYFLKMPYVTIPLSEMLIENKGIC